MLFKKKNIEAAIIKGAIYFSAGGHSEEPWRASSPLDLGHVKLSWRNLYTTFQDLPFFLSKKTRHKEANLLIRLILAAGIFPAWFLGVQYMYHKHSL